jgi:hypothetical protein
MNIVLIEKHPYVVCKEMFKYMSKVQKELILTSPAGNSLGILQFSYKKSGDIQFSRT